MTAFLPFFPKHPPLLSVALASLLVLAGCGGGDATQTTAGASTQKQDSASDPASGGAAPAGEASQGSLLSASGALHVGGLSASGAVNLAMPDLGGNGGGVTPTSLQEYATKVAACAAGDTPETALQGQVPALMRVVGFKGFSCNLELVGRYAGEGGNWSAATFKDNSGHHCAYHSTASMRPGRINPGVPVIDMTDPTRPVRTMSLTSPAMGNPWESLRANPIRQMLFAANGNLAGDGGPEVDIYDLSADCRTPQLLSSTPLNYTAVTKTPVGDSTQSKAIKGHEGNISPDGMTYYVGDNSQNSAYHAIDVTNPTRPKTITSFEMKLSSPIAQAPHGLSISKDGNRAYVVASTAPTPLDVVDPNTVAKNGFLILDTSEVQARKPGAQMKLIASVAFNDGGLAQHTQVVTISGKQHLIMVDEAGPAGLSTAASIKAACNAGLPPFPMARIYDISNEKTPKLVSKLKLETHDPKHCDVVLPDVADLAVFTYGSHYCSVDDNDNATAMACAYFNSGIRVFDIRNPAKPKEIAYFNPAGTQLPQLGSDHTTLGQWRPGGPDWCASRLDFDKKKGLLTTMCQDNGLLVMKFKNGVWPFN